MKTKAQIYKELKKAIIYLYKEENRVLSSDEIETHNEIIARYKERVAILEEILEVNDKC